MKSYVFHYPIRIDDLDYMQIVGNAEWLTILTRARIDLLDKINFPISEMMRLKIGGVVSKLSMEFKKPVYYGDYLKITIRPDNPFKKGLVLKYLVENQKNEECLTAEVTIIFVNESGRSIEMPQKVAYELFDIENQING